MPLSASHGPTSNSLWLIVHERDNPMVLSQTEYEREQALTELKRLLQKHAGDRMHVGAPRPTDEIGRRYEVSDPSGWLATYWLSEEQLAADDGMLTAIVSPGATQRSHYTSPLHR